MGSWAGSFRTQSSLEFRYTALTLPEARYQGKLKLKHSHTKSVSHTCTPSIFLYTSHTAQSKTASRTDRKLSSKTNLLHSSCPCCPVHCQSLKNRLKKNSPKLTHTNTNNLRTKSRDGLFWLTSPKEKKKVEILLDKVPKVTNSKVVRCITKVCIKLWKSVKLPTNFSVATRESANPITFPPCWNEVVCMSLWVLGTP